MTSTPDPSTPQPGPPGFIPILPRRPDLPMDDADLGRKIAEGEWPPGPAYIGPTAYIGAGGTARALADAERNDALVNLIRRAENAASHARTPGWLADELSEAAARARLAFGLRKS